MLKIGPGGIRTHDQRIMSPLRYRCATGPYKVVASCYLVFILGPGLAVATSGATYLSKNPQRFGFFFRQSATGPYKVVASCYLVFI